MRTLAYRLVAFRRSRVAGMTKYTFFGWRALLVLGVVFVAGIIIMRLYRPSTTSVNAFTQYENGNRQTSDGRHIAPSPNGADSQNQVEPVKLPVVKTVLQKPQFSNTWSEDPKLRNLRTYGVVENIPDLDVLNTYDANKLSAIYHSFLDNTDIQCHRKLRMGQVGDGGWEICDDYEWRPIRPCVIYSFGINYDFSFDDDAGKIYGCDVFSFDPSMSKQPTYQRSARVMFYKLGIGAQSGEPEINSKGWVLHSLSNFRAMLNHTDTVIDVIKMDVESAEWAALPSMLKERQLDNVRQLLLEYHTGSDHDTTLRSRLKIIGDLERVGFKKFYVNKNHYCARNALGIPIKRTTCYEIHYVNAKFQRTKGSM